MGIWEEDREVMAKRFAEKQMEEWNARLDVQNWKASLNRERLARVGVINDEVGEETTEARSVDD